MAGGGLDLLVPGLFGPIPIATPDLPPLPVLESILGRADRLPPRASDPVSALLARFGVVATGSGDLPSAVFARLANNPAADPSGFWLHADPVHLRADRARLLLFDSRHLAITQGEADALVGLFNTHFRADGLRLEAPVPHRWYLHSEASPEIDTRPLHLVIGREIAPSLPSGPGARRWAQVLNEAQMLFHTAEVNRRREAAGRPAINGLWTWGGGRLPALPLAGDYGGVCADHPLALGLARAAGVPGRPLEDAGDPLLLPNQGHVLVFWDRLWWPTLDADPAVWIEALAGFERELPLWLQALRDGRIAWLGLDPASGQRFCLTRAGLRRFWRRPFPLVRLMRPRELA